MSAHAAMSSTVQFVLFDLDGTVSDSAPGILASLRAAFAEMGLPPMDAATEQSLLGPPFRDTFPAIMDDDRVEEAISRYRVHYTAGGMLNTSAYDGIPATLAALRELGMRIGLATSKAEFLAEPVLDHLGLLEHFEVVAGDLPDGGRGSKSAVVAEALRRFGDPDRELVLMVGDRSYDVLGAGEHGIRTVGAGWGYGAPGELVQAGAIAILDRPEQILGHLGRSA